MPTSDHLARILASPKLERLVPRLHPEVLYQVIQRRGLEDCADIVALATTEQLTRVFDLDLWRPARPGYDEVFDADRFGVWLDVLMESGPAVAAGALIRMDVDLVVAALAQHVRVFDSAAAARDGFEIGTYLVVPTRTASWDAIVSVLLHLDAEHHDYFNRLMGGCRVLSNAGFEADGLHDLLGHAEQTLFDVAFEREQRRETQGYVTPAQARAFLRLARERRHDGGLLGRNPVAVAYFRGLGQTPGLVRPDDDTRAARALEEIAFLANALMAGCSLQGRAFTPDEASRAAAAICTLGAENEPGPSHDVLRAFEIGWGILHQQVCLAAANRLRDVLRDLRSDDREIQSDLDTLRLDLGACTRDGEPWRARDGLDVIMMLDMPAWAALVGLIAECPVIHAAIHARGARTVSASDFEFIFDQAQLGSIRDFLEVLPAIGRYRLCGDPAFVAGDHGRGRDHVSQRSGQRAEASVQAARSAARATGIVHDAGWPAVHHRDPGDGKVRRLGVAGSSPAGPQ
jgi:hypothetical protein